MSQANSQVTDLLKPEASTKPAPPPAKKAAVEAKAVTGANHDIQLSGEKRIITIHQAEGDGGSDAVFISLNGYGYQVPRGEPQEVPVELVEILKNAQTKTYQTGPGGQVTERTVPRFAYSLQ